MPVFISSWESNMLWKRLYGTLKGLCATSKRLSAPSKRGCVLLEFIILCGPFLSFSDLCCSFCMWYFSVGEYVFFRYFLLCWLTSLLSFCFMRIFHGFLDLFQMNVCSFWLAMLMILVLKISLIMRFSSFIFFFNLWPKLVTEHQSHLTLSFRCY